MGTLRKYLNSKFIAALSVLFSTIAIAVAFQNPAQGYELSIYDSTPFIVWLSLILSIIGALFIVLYQIYTNKYMSSNFWITGIFILLFDRLIILYIPYIRGYISWREDNISHVGYFIDIITSGYISSDDFYPVTHILLAMLYTVTEISQSIVVNYSTGIFSIFYVILIYLLARVILHTKKERILAVTSVVAVFFSYNVYLMPNGWSQLYLPLLVFLYFKSLEKDSSSQYKLLFVISLIMYPFFHPLSSLYSVFILTYIGIAFFLIHLFLSMEKIDEKLINQKEGCTFTGQLTSDLVKCLKTGTKTGTTSISTFIRNDNSSFPLTAIFIEIIILIPWILSFQAFEFNLKTFYDSVLTGTSPDVIAGMQNILGKINISGMDFLYLLIKMEGANLIFLGLFFISLLILNKERHYLQKNKSLLILSGVTVFTGLIYAGYLFGLVPGLHVMAAQRVKSYIVLFTPISAGFVFNYFFKKKLVLKKVNLFPLICIFVILTASTLSISSLYSSPNIISPNFSITEMDMQGAEWFLDHHNKEVLTTHILSPLYRFIDGITGTAERNVIFGSIYKHTTVPDHFNYNEMSKLGESYPENRYMMITLFDILTYEAVWREVGRFNYQDFDRLLEDNSVEKLYSNGETELFFIHTV